MFDDPENQSVSRVPGQSVAHGRAHDLDNERNTAFHRRTLGIYVRELERQTENRYEMAEDEDFYDNIQWNEEDSSILAERGQEALVYNVISASVNWVIGTEKRGRSAFKILPRRETDIKQAETKTKLLKYLSDTNSTPFHRSRAFEDATKVGVGWLEDGLQAEGDGEPIYSRYESWRNMLWDSTATEMDLQDARYIFRTKWVDEDIACSMFSDRRGLIAESIDQPGYGMSLGSYGDYAMDGPEQENLNLLSSVSDVEFDRPRIRCIEAWIRRPMKVKRVMGGSFSGEIFDPASRGHQLDVQEGVATLVDRMAMRMHVAIMTQNGLLTFEESPYRHNRFPFTPVWGYRRGRDGMPYGMIRGLKDPQVDINKRASKATYILSTNKVIMEKGAVDDIEELREEIARPDAIIVTNTNKKFETNVDRELAAAHLQMMANSIQMIERASGVNDDNLGRKTNAQSGIAIERRQEQGSMVTTKFFDNLRYSSQKQGEKQLSLNEQFTSAKKQFRITNERGKPAFITVNDGLPENDIMRSAADFIISEADWRNSIREAQAAELLNLFAKFPPQVVLVMLDLLIEHMDVPNRDELVKRIRMMSGMKDPDADPNEVTPEQQAKAQAEAEAAAIQKANIEAEIRSKMARAAKDEAGAQLVMGQLTRSNVDAQQIAINAAREAMLSPQAVPIADVILAEAGFESASDKETMQAATRLAAERQQEEMAAQQQQAQQPDPNAPPEQLGQPIPPQTPTIGVQTQPA